MNYEQFVDAMLTCTREKLVGTAIVDRQEILRNNGVTSIGLSIREKGKDSAPVIYLEEYYQKYSLGADVESLSEHLIRMSREAMPAPKWDYAGILNFQKIRHRIVYKLVNAKHNRKLLKEVPNLPMLDFAIIFCVLIPAEGEEICSIMIRNAHMDYWKVPISVLYEHAKENTPKLCPFVFRPLSEFVEEALEENVSECPMYVLTNENGNNGANVILYPQMMNQLYEYFGKNYYLLPSSIHEFLILPEDDIEKAAELKEIVQNVNGMLVAKEDILSDSVYYFDGNIITKM